MQLFGTDGIRGTPGKYPLTNAMLGKIGQAVARNLKTHRSKVTIVIGRDTRLSGEKLEKVLAQNISKTGSDVILAGTITTPGLSFLTKRLKADAGIMISASHNKAPDNGLKFFDSKGEKFTQAREEKIEELIFGDIPKTVVSKKQGKIRLLKDARSCYVKFLLSTVKGLSLKGLKIALDCAWGAASPFAKKIFTQLGAKVTSIHDKPSGHKINMGGAINPALLKDLVLKTKADLGIAVDGDGDRGILVDEQGQLVDGDCIMAVVARHLAKDNKLPKNTVVATVMSNYGLKVSLGEIGAKLITTNVGDKYVLESLLNNDLILGGEQSGHIIFLNYHPTPDGLLTALQVLKVMRESNLPLSQLCQCISKFPQVLVNVKVKERRPFEQMPKVSEKLQYFNNRLKDEGRILLRYSGTEPLARVMVEGRDHDIITNIANSLAEEIRKELGTD